MKFILGSGIVGMIACFYLKDFIVLTKGKGQDGTRIGPKIIKKTPFTEKFIEKLNRKTKGTNYTIHPRQFKCSYNVNGKLTQKITEEQTRQYIMKTRGDSDIEKFKRNALNDGMASMEGYYMDEVYIALSSTRDAKIRRMFMNIKKLDTKHGRIEGNNPSIGNIEMSVNYERLINTLPAHLFNYLISGDKEKLYSPKSEIIILIVRSEELVKSLENNNFVYYVDKNIPYYRISKIGHNMVAVETKKPFFPAKVFKERYRIINTIKLPFGKISDNIRPRLRTNISHLGRYANNDNGLRVHDVIEMFEKGEIET